MKNSEFDQTSLSNGDTSHDNAPGESRAESLVVLVWLADLARTVLYQDALGGVPLDDAIEKPPKHIGHFRLEGLLGAGSYGAVFRAFDQELERWVALKLAWPHVMFDAVSSRRFVEEPKAVAALNHPGIVKVHKSGSVDSVRYIALELVDGPTLGEWFKRQEHVPLRIAAQIVSKVAEAIHFAHQHEIIHRDLKPNNVLLRPSADSEFPYQPVVTDFGLARRPRPMAASNLTGTHEVLGTDPYSSPEQLQRGAATVGPASDVYALGVMLYELVAGRRPFDGESADQARLQVLHDEPPAIRSSRQRVPRDLDTIIHKCLEKSPAQRYASARDLAGDLTRFLNHEPIRARPTRLWQRGVKYAKRKPLVVSLVSLALVSLLVTAGLLAILAVNRIAADQQIAVAEATATVAAGIERQHQYVSGIQHAAEALRQGKSREVLESLQRCQLLAREPVKCGIEWDWLSAQVNRAERTINAHPKGVCAVRYSPKGDLLASSGRDGRVVLWDTTTWNRRAEWTYGSDVEVCSTDFSADGSLLAVGGDDGRLVVYRVSDASVIFDERIVQGRVYDLVWVGDSMQIAVGGDGTTLFVVDPVSHGYRQTTLDISAEGRLIDPGHPDEINALVYVRSRNAIAVFLTPPTTYFVDPVTLDVLPPSLARAPSIGAVCSIPLDHEYLAATGRNSNVELWNAADGRCVASVPVLGQVRAMRYSMATGSLALALRDGAIEVLHVPSILDGKEQSAQRLCAHSDRAVAVDVSPEGDRFVTAGWDGDIKLWRFASIQQPFEVNLPSAPLRIEFSRDGELLAVACATQQGVAQVQVFSVDSGTVLWTTTLVTKPFERADTELSLCTFAPLGAELTITDGSSIRRHDARTGKIKSNQPLPLGTAVRATSYSPDGKLLLVRRSGGHSIVLDTATGDSCEHISAPEWSDLGVFRTIHGDCWLEASVSGTLSLREMHSSTAVSTLAGATEQIGCATISSDGRYLAAGGLKGIVYFWDLTSPDSASQCVGHEAGIGDLRFSSDGRAIISSSYDGTVRLWHVPTHVELLRFGTPRQRVVSMSLNASGSLLVLGVEVAGRHGLQFHRIGPERDKLPQKFATPPVGQP